MDAPKLGSSLAPKKKSDVESESFIFSFAIRYARVVSDEAKVVPGRVPCGCLAGTWLQD